MAPSLAAAAERVGWEFDCYYGAPRRGRHFGGGDPALAREGWPAGSLVAGGRHAEHALALARRFDVVVLGDPECVLWPALEAAGVEALAPTLDPDDLYAAFFARASVQRPQRVLLLDGEQQGADAVVTAPYLYPAFWHGEPALGYEASIERLPDDADVTALYASEETQGRLPGMTIDGDVGERTWAEVTAELAERHSDWGRGVLLGDPDLVAAQLPRARRLRLLPLYARPQTEVLRRAHAVVETASNPVFGRQYDDHDFFELARTGHAFQLVDPDPPFGGVTPEPVRVPEPPSRLRDLEPDDAQLARWADERRVLATVLFWSGMVREVDCIPRLVDVTATTGVRAGLVLTTASLENADRTLALLAASADRGGVFGHLEPLLASAGSGVAAESLLPESALVDLLSSACDVAAAVLPDGLRPRGWWPLLDAPLVAHRTLPVGRRGLRPVVRFVPRGPRSGAQRGEDMQGGWRGLRSLAGDVVRSAHLESMFEARRPFEQYRPGKMVRAIRDAVGGAGFEYMWTKTQFGLPRVVLHDRDFVSLTLTAGNWDGWSPFYTVGSTRDLVRAEAKLLARREPGWLVGTVDAPLFALSGEVLEHGARLYRMAALTAAGGKTGRLVNVLPNTVARYARLLHERRLLPEP